MDRKYNTGLVKYCHLLARKKYKNLTSESFVNTYGYILKQCSVALRLHVITHFSSLYVLSTCSKTDAVCASISGHDVATALWYFLNDSCYHFMFCKLLAKVGVCWRLGYITLLSLSNSAVSVPLCPWCSVEYDPPFQCVTPNIFPLVLPVWPLHHPLFFFKFFACLGPKRKGKEIFSHTHPLISLTHFI